MRIPPSRPPRPDPAADAATGKVPPLVPVGWVPGRPAPDTPPAETDSALRPLAPLGAREEVPIVLIAEGAAPTLGTCLRQARKSNPGARILVLGDGAVGSLAERFPIAGFADKAEAFARVYRPSGAEDGAGAPAGLRRWFLLSAFLEAEGIPRCFLMEPDTLVYCDVAEEFRRFGQVPLAADSVRGGGGAFVGSPAAAERLCGKMLAAFTGGDAPLAAGAGTHFGPERKPGAEGTGPEAFFLRVFRESDPSAFAETLGVRDGAAFDDGITRHRPVWEADGDLKKIRWRDDVPYGRRLLDGMDIRFLTLRFPGAAAAHMERFLRA